MNEFFSKYKFKKIGFIDPNKVVAFIFGVRKFFIVHRIKKSFYLSVLFVLFLITSVSMGLCLSSRTMLTTHHVDCEINTALNTDKFIKEDINTSEVSVDETELDLTKVGQYRVLFRKNNIDEVLFVNVVDTTPPEFNLKECYSEVGADIEPASLVEDLKDESKVTFKLSDTEEYTEKGDYEITVTATDSAGNKTDRNTVLHLRKDDEAPKLLNGSALSSNINEEVDYKKLLKVKDNYDPSPEVTVDDSKVDYSKYGRYPISITAKDRAGNKKVYKENMMVQSAKGYVYLTFDDGPSQNTKSVLDILNKNNIHATFFVTCGSKEYRKYIKEAYESGNTIALHTAHHNYAKLYSSKKAYFKDLEAVSDMVEDLIGVKAKHIRFPGGSSNQISNRYSKGIMKKLIPEVTKRGYKYYDWNVDSGDADYPSKSKKAIYKRATASDRKEIMILFHDSAAKKNTVKALPKIIKYYKSKGYVFLSLDERDYLCQHVVMED